MTNALIGRYPDILGGNPVFAGIRVLVYVLMEHLEAGDRLDDFLTDDPAVFRLRAVALLKCATTTLIPAAVMPLLDEAVPRHRAWSFQE